MFIKRKKNGYSFVQSIFVFFIVLVIFNLCLRFINYNYLKGMNFKTYSDKKTLSMEEELFLKFINENINSKEISLDLEKLNDLKETNKEFNKYNLIILNEKYYITKVKNNTQMYIGLEQKIENNSVKFIPTYYKTDYIVYKKG